VQGHESASSVQQPDSFQGDHAAMAVTINGAVPTQAGNNVGLRRTGEPRIYTEQSFELRDRKRSGR
jgi:hypothetical protein